MIYSWQCLINKTSSIFILRPLGCWTLVHLSIYCFAVKYFEHFVEKLLLFCNKYYPCVQWEHKNILESSCSKIIRGILSSLRLIKKFSVGWSAPIVRGMLCCSVVCTVIDNPQVKTEMTEYWMKKAQMSCTTSLRDRLKCMSKQSRPTLDSRHCAIETFPILIFFSLIFAPSAGHLSLQSSMFWSS